MRIHASALGGGSKFEFITGTKAHANLDIGETLPGKSSHIRLAGRTYPDIFRYPAVHDEFPGKSSIQPVGMVPLELFGL
jgi:hypothetical protein